MEKKTIGKFIAVLRKANGMTQQELGDKLLVSDNTVSKWERDERMPDISLLPAIAEIFGITTDELLRGERNNTERENYGTKETQTKNKAKSDKQFENMLDKKLRLYNSLTCLSVAIMIFGLIIGFLLVIYLAEPLMLSVCGGMMVAAQVCQIIFVNNALIRPDDDEQYLHRIGRFNSRIINVAAWLTIANVSINVCLVLIAIDMFGIIFGPGAIAAITLALAGIIYSVYILVVRKAFEKRGFITYDREKAGIVKYRTSLLKKFVVICGIGTIVLFSVGHGIIGAISSEDRYYLQYDNVEDFKKQMETEYDAWCEELKDVYCVENEDGEIVFYEELYKKNCESVKHYGKIKNSNGEVLCEYYCLKDSYKNVRVYCDVDGNLQISYFNEANYRLALENKEIARIHFNNLNATCLGICAIVYIVMASTCKKKVLVGEDHADKAEEAVQEEIVEQ
ncbi:MAG: helix-turn-helix transcriptional regulator [Clostridia bacterium]|nr:helix-turn-helix transcriptional regulator [Clostridia bacterium]